MNCRYSSVSYTPCRIKFLRVLILPVIFIIYIFSETIVVAQFSIDWQRPSVSLKVFPDYSTDILQLQSSGFLASPSLVIVDLSGRVCSETRLTPGSFWSVPVGGIPDGLYLIMLYTGNIPLCSVKTLIFKKL